MEVSQFALADISMFLFLLAFFKAKLDFKQETVESACTGVAKLDGNIQHIHGFMEGGSPTNK